MELSVLLVGGSGCFSQSSLMLQGSRVCSWISGVRSRAPGSCAVEVFGLLNQIRRACAYLALNHVLPSHVQAIETLDVEHRLVQGFGIWGLWAASVSEYSLSVPRVLRGLRLCSDSRVNSEPS